MTKDITEKLDWIDDALLACLDNFQSISYSHQNIVEKDVKQAMSDIQNIRNELKLRTEKKHKETFCPACNTKSYWYGNGFSGFNCVNKKKQLEGKDDE